MKHWTKKMNINNEKIMDDMFAEVVRDLIIEFQQTLYECDIPDVKNDTEKTNVIRTVIVVLPTITQNNNIFRNDMLGTWRYDRDPDVELYRKYTKDWIRDKVLYAAMEIACE